MSMAALWLVLLLGVVATAGAADLYRVTGIPVDVTADSAVAARAKALAQGQRDGLATLLRRLVSPADLERLPSVDQLPVERFVFSTEITDEKVAPTRYLARLNVSYAPDAVQALLRRARVPFVDRRTGPILVVPAVRQGDQLSVWVEANPWRQAWNAAVNEASFATLALPLYDLTDAATAPPEMIAIGDETALSALAGRYDAEAVVVAAVDLERDPATGALRNLGLSVRRSDDWSQPLVEEAATVPPDLDEAEALERAATRVVEAVENDWKRRNLVRSDELSRLSVAVPLADLAGWVQIRRALSGLPEVRALEVGLFSRELVRLTIGYIGELGDLVAAVERLGLMLTEENDGWLLRPAGVQAGYPAPVSGSPATP